ncbi:MAG: threonylcarbamoyl-AMP synthase [Bdellovibrionales bacterium RBG_16_40_8]|nr:MAG: threonylcarbamoyl-AMP synthase [Bdellovibrionales bacterium RBG_16_40_8]
MYEQKLISAELTEAIRRLLADDVVSIPTETVYGLAADITNSVAVDKIFTIKERPFFDPLIVHIYDRMQADDVVAYFPTLAEKLAKKFWPGPLTMVLPKRSDLNPKITAGLDTVGVRVPKHELTRELIRLLKRPLVAPSANKFGRTSPTTAEHVHAEFDDNIFVLDGGPCEVGVESTVVGFNTEFNEIYIYRPGAITYEMLSDFAPVNTSSSPASPGQLDHHYRPTLPLVILSTTPYLTNEIYYQLTRDLKVAELYPSWMKLPEEPTIAARLLYANLRKSAQKPGANCILFNYNLDEHISGLDIAITNRLKRAASIIL